MAMQKSLDDSLPFQIVASFFCNYVLEGVFKENQHLLIMDGHGFHITIQAL
jgi:hypothetical protein